MRLAGVRSAVILVLMIAPPVTSLADSAATNVIEYAGDGAFGSAVSLVATERIVILGELRAAEVTLTAPEIVVLGLVAGLDARVPGASGGRVTIVTDRLVVGEGAELRGGDGAAGLDLEATVPDTGITRRLAGRGGEGGDIVVRARDLDVRGLLVAGAAGRGGHAEVDLAAWRIAGHDVHARGGDAGSPGTVLVNGVSSGTGAGAPGGSAFAAAPSAPQIASASCGMRGVDGGDAFNLPPPPGGDASVTAGSGTAGANGCDATQPGEDGSSGGAGGRGGDAVAEAGDGAGPGGAYCDGGDAVARGGHGAAGGHGGDGARGADARYPGPTPDFGAGGQRGGDGGFGGPGGRGGDARAIGGEPCVYFRSHGAAIAYGGYGAAGGDAGQGGAGGDGGDGTVVCGAPGIAGESREGASGGRAGVPTAVSEGLRITYPGTPGGPGRSAPPSANGRQGVGLACLNESQLDASRVCIRSSTEASRRPGFSCDAAFSAYGPATGQFVSLSATESAEGGFVGVTGTGPRASGVALGLAPIGSAAGTLAISVGGSASGPVAIAVLGPASGTVAASGVGNADGPAAVSGTGRSTGLVTASGAGPAEGLVAISGTGPAGAPGSLVAVSGTGPSSGQVLAVSGTGSACGTVTVTLASPSCGPGTLQISGGGAPFEVIDSNQVGPVRPLHVAADGPSQGRAWIAIARDDARPSTARIPGVTNLGVAAISLDGDASTAVLAVAPAGRATTSNVAVGQESAQGFVAVSKDGPASGFMAVSGFGAADDPNGFQGAHNGVAVSGAGPARGQVAASGTGDANGSVLAVSGTGSASGPRAVGGGDILPGA